MVQSGVVTKTYDNMATVRFKRASACGENCAMCSGCNKRNSFVEAINCAGANIGDSVIIETSTKTVLLGAFFAYIFPIILAITFYYIFGALWAIIGFVLPFILLFFINKYIEKRYCPKIIDILVKE